MILVPLFFWPGFDNSDSCITPCLTVDSCAEFEDDDRCAPTKAVFTIAGVVTDPQITILGPQCPLPPSCEPFNRTFTLVRHPSSNPCSWISPTRTDYCPTEFDTTGEFFWEIFVSVANPLRLELKLHLSGISKCFCDADSVFIIEYRVDVVCSECSSLEFTLVFQSTCCCINFPESVTVEFL